MYSPEQPASVGLPGIKRASGAAAVEIGGTLGIAVFSTIAAGTGVLAGPQAASGISHAFVAGAILAMAGMLAASAWFAVWRIRKMDA